MTTKKPGGAPRRAAGRSGRSGGATGRSGVKPGRSAPEAYEFFEDESPYGAKKPARAKAKPDRGALLPFGDDGYPSGRAAKAPYPGDRPERGGRAASERPAQRPRAEDRRPERRAPDERYPVRAARGYDEELPVRRKPRAQSPRPMPHYRDELDEYERSAPRRKAGARKAKRKKKSAAGSAFLYWAIAAVLALLIGFGVRTFGFELISVRGDAMLGTLAEGDVAVIKKAVYYAQKPARGDIVAIHSPDGRLIRRVVALPGETIEIRRGVTYVNDERLDEPYIQQPGADEYPLTTIPEGGYFVMCDNRLNLDDSRAFGSVKNTRSLVIGKVDQIVWPLSGWGEIG